MWQTICVFGAVARVEANACAVLDDLKSEAVPFRLVQPVVAFGWTHGGRRGQGADKREVHNSILAWVLARGTGARWLGQEMLLQVAWPRSSTSLPGGGRRGVTNGQEPGGPSHPP